MAIEWAEKCVSFRRGPADRHAQQGKTIMKLASYRIDGEHLQPTRYGTSSDVQLWNTTSLAVQWALSRLPRGLMAR